MNNSTKKRKTKKFQKIIQNYWPSFLERYSDLVPDHVTKTFSKIVLCGTEALGCHVYKCVQCGFTLLIKHSCKMRFCSCCATAYIDKWSAKIKYMLGSFSASYYFITFTIPKQLELIVKVNKRIMFNALFSSASYSILSFYKEKRVICGIIALIHIVGRLINFHPHIHLLASYGGLVFNKSAWKEVFLPANVLQARFKKHFLDTLRTYYKQGKLKLPEELAFKNFAEFDIFLRKTAKMRWQIKRKGPMNGLNAAIAYVARYLGKPPISEKRICWFNSKTICFTFKDYINKAINRKCYLNMDEFFKRIIHSVPLSRFPMVRSYGLFSTRKKKEYLAVLKELCPVEGLPPLAPPKNCREHRRAKTGEDPLICPDCNIELELQKVYFPGSLDNTSFEELLEDWSKDKNTS